MVPWIEISIGGGTLGMLGLVLRFMNGKIDKKQDKDTCKVHVDTFIETLQELKAQNKGFVVMGEMVARIDERTLALAKKNGIEK